MGRLRPAMHWLGWSPVAAVLWAALAVGAASGLRGCSLSMPAPSPSGPDWIPPNPPQPPAPTPNPMGKALQSARWEWRAFPRDGDALDGWEAECADLDGVTVMRLIRPRARR